MTPREQEGYLNDSAVEPDSCDGCKFWSELVASAIGGEQMKALCLNSQASRYGKMVCDGCNKYEAGRAIDDPSRR